MKLEEFNYDLPKELIAQEPAEPRDSCRLMMLDKNTGEWEHHGFRDILNEIRKGDIFVFNNTKVIPARLYGKKKDTGGKVEMLLLTPKGNDVWEVLVNPGRKALPGTEIEFSDDCYCKVLDKTEFGGRLVEFHYNGNFDSLLDQIGEMPTPPYIHKKLDNNDEYQTVYAKYKGSAAAPTAGLHFTPELMEEMKKKRFYAITIDFFIACFMAWVVDTIISLIVTPSPTFVMFPTACAMQLFMYWFFCKDCCKGMSPGKRIMGIQVINLKTHNIAGPLRCVARNLCYCMNFIEFIIFFASPKGERVGDILTSTRVVEKDCNLRQELKSVVFTFIVFLFIWILGVVISYVKLKSFAM